MLENVHTLNLSYCCEITLGNSKIKWSCYKLSLNDTEITNVSMLGHILELSLCKNIKMC